MLRSSCVTEKLLVPQGLSSMDLVNQTTKMPSNFARNIFHVQTRNFDPLPHTFSVRGAQVQGTFAK
jgi:hypothetical protein